MTHEFKPIGVIHSPFKEKFCIPRQPGLVRSVESIIRIPNDDRLKTGFQGIESFSHLWVIFVFHDTGTDIWKPSVRPPRLGGNKKVGVFASRSPHRLNPIGLSVVELVGVSENENKELELLISGGDFLDQTPVLDIKPYIEYCDSIQNTKKGWAQKPIERHPVYFSEKADHKISKANQPNLKNMIEEILSLDPRPAFQKRKLEEGHFGFHLLQYDVKWKIKNKQFFVDDLIDIESN